MRARAIKGRWGRGKFFMQQTQNKVTRIIQGVIP
jgi:hypothetical protein